MTGRRLLAWGDRDDRRRRTARRVLVARFSPWLISCLGAVVLAAEMARRLGLFGTAAAAGASLAGTLRLWLAITSGLHVIVLFGSPHRLFWRRDAALLARLPIPGGPLYRLAVLRSARAAAQVALPCAAAALAFGPVLGWAAAARLVALVAGAALIAGLLGPAVALAAGAVVASERAQAMIGSVAGEFKAPASSWLGILPGVAGTGLVVLMVVLAPWAAGTATITGTGTGTAATAATAAAASASLAYPVALLAAALITLLATALALAGAGRIVPAALREVSALDRERLAHIELVKASSLERTWFGVVLRGAGARLVAGKDAALSRRRYPSPYFLGPLAVVILWIVALAGGAGALTWAGALLLVLSAYAAMMARRLVQPPVELPRLLVTLPIAPSQARAGKRAAVALRAITWPALGGVPLAATSPDPLTSWLVVAAAVAVALVGGYSALGD